MIAPPDIIVEEARQGRMFILIDDEGRENEGDLVIPADCVEPAHIAFMAREGRGLICLAMAATMADGLGLAPLGTGAKFGTAFAMPFGARDGISTGISAADRAHSIRTALAGGPLATPGHVFPLRAREGGVLERPGHTEASVDVMRLSGRAPAAVICEIMNDDGTMARLPELTVFAKKHGIKLGTIADLAAFLSPLPLAGEG